MLQRLQPSALTRSCLLLPHLPSVWSRLRGRGQRPRDLLLLPIGDISGGIAPQLGLRGQLELPSPLVVGLESEGGWSHGGVRRRRNSNNFFSRFVLDRRLWGRGKKDLSRGGGWMGPLCQEGPVGVKKAGVEGAGQASPARGRSFQGKEGRRRCGRAFWGEVS